jgi:hypothetical protein
MTPRHIYDVERYWVAFVVGTEVFLRGGEWLGRLSGTNEIRDRDGQLRGLLDARGQMSLIDAEPFQMTVSGPAPSRETERDAEKFG